MNYRGTEQEIDDAISEVVAEAQWHKEKQTIEEFLSDFRIAQPIRISHPASFDMSPADTLHPFLAFSRRRRTKVYAENLIWNETLKKYKRRGPALEIPKDYPGWFEILPNHSKKTTIADIVAMKSKQFLVRTAVIGHLAEGGVDGSEPELGCDVRIYPGDILEVGEVVTKTWRTMSPLGAAGKKPKPKPVATKFLECVDHDRRRIYLPLAHPGEFYAVWDEGVGNATTQSEYAYYIYDLLQFKFPLMVRLVFGWPPADFPDFGGLLRLTASAKPDSLVVRNLRHGSCVIAELPASCDARIERLANVDFLSGNGAFEKLLAHCSDRIYPYLIGMKEMDKEYPLLEKREQPHRLSIELDDPGFLLLFPKHDRGFMARPRDMKHFDILNVFPPLEDAVRQVADSWTLCFKDPALPATAADQNEYSVGGGDPDGDAEPSAGIKGIKINDPQEMRRRQMDHVLLEREADC